MQRETIGQFIDASVLDHVEAKRLLTAHPELREATWLGDEPVLIFLVIENFPAGVSFCVENGFDVNQVDDEFATTALHYACILNYTEVGKILLAAGANPNAMCKIHDTPIHCSVAKGNAEILDQLIQYGADPNYTTELGETIFDNWPSWAAKELGEVIRKHNIKPSIE